MLNRLQCCDCGEVFESEINQYHTQRNNDIAMATAIVQCPNCKNHVRYDLYDSEIHIVNSSDGNSIYYILAIAFAMPIIVWLAYLYLSN
jgi:NAD-dependent SIR2 family protein deacetylase